MKRILLAILIILALQPVPRAWAQGLGITYVVDVDEYGNATVVMVVRAGGSGELFTYLPRFENWTTSVWSGELVDLRLANTTAYFYYNATIGYRAGPNGLFGLNITFHFPYASLYSGTTAWFLTPLLGAPAWASVEVVVSLANLASIDVVTVNNAVVGYERSGSTVTVRVPAGMAAAGGRVSIDYSLTRDVGSKVFEERVDGTVVRVTAPPFYRGYASRIVDVLRRAMPYLREVFGGAPDAVDFTFFLPERVDLSVYGYVMGEDINAMGRGPIHLNLALVRFKEGFLENTIVHEYVHLALGTLGVEASSSLRWFHEGMAQYISIEVCKKMGLDMADVEEPLREMAGFYASRPGFVQAWREGGDPTAYYAASYYIISSLAERYGGLNFTSRLARELRSMGGASSNAELVEAISRAAGEDLTGQFREWGFNVAPASLLQVRGGLLILLAAATLAVVAAAGLIVILHSGRRRRCPYCLTPLRGGETECPYCGFPLTRRGEEPGGQA